MTDTYIHHMPAHSALPDPATDPQFYDGVRSRRAIAWVLDLIAIAMLSAVTMFFVGIATLGLGLLATPLIATIVGFGYRYLSIAATSRTPGMAMMGLEFRNVMGRLFDRTDALVHTGLYTLVFVSGIGQLLTCASTLLTQRKQTIPDLITGSAVINRPR